jgi:hypothetical protein
VIGRCHTQEVKQAVASNSMNDLNNFSIFYLVLLVIRIRMHQQVVTADAPVNWDKYWQVQKKIVAQSLPAQMYVKISNVSANRQTRI